MYRAKDAGRNCIAFYDESMHERVAHRLAVETALYRALDRRELRLFHQPILDLETGEVVGFEALMRWQQGDGTIVSPAEFIPIAEDTGTIVPIGAWALLEALTQLRALDRRRGVQPDGHDVGQRVAAPARRPALPVDRQRGARPLRRRRRARCGSRSPRA